jgi:hypothetical protein
VVIPALQAVTKANVHHAKLKLYNVAAVNQSIVKLNVGNFSTRVLPSHANVFANIESHVVNISVVNNVASTKTLTTTRIINVFWSAKNS